MGGRGPQTFKKRQKEQQRKEKQQEKMAKRLQRKSEPKTGPIIEAFDPFFPDEEVEDTPAGDEPSEL